MAILLVLRRTNSSYPVWLESSPRRIKKHFEESHSGQIFFPDRCLIYTPGHDKFLNKRGALPGKCGKPSRGEGPPVAGPVTGMFTFPFWIFSHLNRWLEERRKPFGIGNWSRLERGNEAPQLDSEMDYSIFGVKNPHPAIIIMSYTVQIDVLTFQPLVKPPQLRQITVNLFSCFRIGVVVIFDAVFIYLNLYLFKH